MFNMLRLIYFIIVPIFLFPVTSFANFSFNQDHLLYYPAVHWYLSWDFVPQDLVLMSDFWINIMRANDTEWMIRSVVANDLKSFQQFCEKQVWRKLPIRSWYRSFIDQNFAYLKHQDLWWSALPWSSEHQLWLAVDFGFNDVFFDDDGYSLITKCLRENANNFWFILSYWKYNPFYSYEPWHFRYVWHYMDLFKENNFSKTPWELFKNVNNYLHEYYSAKLKQRLEESKKRKKINKLEIMWSEIAGSFNLNRDWKAMIFLKKNILLSAKNWDWENFFKFSSVYNYLRNN